MAGEYRVISAAERLEIARELKKRPAGEDPAKPFFLAVSIANLDGSIEGFSGQGVEGCFETMDQAVDELMSLNDSYPTIEGWVYECVPVRRVWRGKCRTDTIRASKRK